MGGHDGSEWAEGFPEEMKHGLLASAIWEPHLDLSLSHGWRTCLHPSKPGSAVIPLQISILLLPGLMVSPQDIVFASGVSSIAISLCQG